LLSTTPHVAHVAHEHQDRPAAAVEAVEPEQSVDVTHLAPGAEVRAQYTTDGDSFFDAKIVCKNDDGSYDLAWNDGDTLHTQGKTCDQLKVRASQLLPEHLALLASGDKVECYYRANTNWYGATIQEAVEHSDLGKMHEFQILWNDGDTSDRVKQLREVRLAVSVVASRVRSPSISEEEPSAQQMAVMIEEHIVAASVAVCAKRH
jgi:hypothetical protein